MKKGAGSVPDDVKIPKLAVSYAPPLPRGLQGPPRTGRTCETCYFAYLAPKQAQGGCFIVQGAIHRGGSCILWNYTGTVPLNFESGPQIAKRLRDLEPFLVRMHRR